MALSMVAPLYNGVALSMEYDVSAAGHALDFHSAGSTAYLTATYTSGSVGGIYAIGLSAAFVSG